MLLMVSLFSSFPGRWSITCLSGPVSEKTQNGLSWHIITPPDKFLKIAAGSLNLKKRSFKWVLGKYVLQKKNDR
jgi:hypothetical protein